MNPLLSSFLGSLVRWLLSVAGGALLVRNSVISGTELDTYVAAAAIAAPALLWSLWEKYHSKLMLNTAVQSPATTVAAVKEQIRDTPAAENVQTAFAAKPEK